MAGALSNQQIAEHSAIGTVNAALTLELKSAQQTTNEASRQEPFRVASPVLCDLVFAPAWAERLVVPLEQEFAPAFEAAASPVGARCSHPLSVRFFGELMMLR